MLNSRFSTLLVLAVAFIGIWAADHTPHPSKEPNEGESVSFIYNGHSHNLLIKVRHGNNVKCYVITLTDADRMSVHSDDGMRMIELSYLAQLAGATKTTVDTLTAFDKKSCGHAFRNGTMEYFSM